MRIKYLGTKVAVILLTVLATPVVWAALAWPEWQAASPPDFAASTIQSATPLATQEAQPGQPQVIRQVVIIPRYVIVEASPVPGQPAPAGPVSSLPTPQPIVVREQPAEPAPQATQPPAAASGGSGSNGSTSAQSSDSNSGKASQNSQTSSSRATTRGS